MSGTLFVGGLRPEPNQKNWRGPLKRLADSRRCEPRISAKTDDLFGPEHHGPVLGFIEQANSIERIPIIVSNFEKVRLVGGDGHALTEFPTDINRLAPFDRQAPVQREFLERDDVRRFVSDHDGSGASSRKSTCPQRPPLFFFSLSPVRQFVIEENHGFRVLRSARRYPSPILNQFPPNSRLPIPLVRIHFRMSRTTHVFPCCISVGA